MAVVHGFAQTVAADWTQGGTINGDFTINGDLEVLGTGSLTVDQLLEGNFLIDATNTEAFLVRKDSDGGDVFTVDTTNSKIITPTINATSAVQTGGSTRIDSSGAYSGTSGTFSGTVSAEQLTSSDDLTVSGLATIGESLGVGTTLGVTGVATFTAQSVHSGGLTAGNLTLADGSITDSSGTIDFGNENLTTSGALTVGSFSIANITITNTATIGTMAISGGSIIDSSGSIDFGNENLATTGTLGAGVSTLGSGSSIGNLTLASGSITDSGGVIDFGNENLTTTGDITTTGTVSAEQLTTTDDITVADTASIDGTLTLATGSITDSTGDISFGNENLVTTGTLGSGAFTSSAGIAGTTGSFSGAITATTLDTGQGANELYDMDQNVTQASAVTFATGTSIGNLTLANGSITDSGGSLSFGNENIATTGTLGAGVATLASGSTIGNLTLADGSITDSGGSVSFGNENIFTTGYAGIGTGMANAGIDNMLTVQGTDLGTGWLRAAGQRDETISISADDAGVDITSSNGGAWGSQLNFKEVNGTTFVDNWSIVRQAGGSGNSSLNFRYGTTGFVDGSGSATTSPLALNIDGTSTFGGAITADTLNTGQGNNDLYAMDQAVRTTDAVTFATVDTGQGANELYDMDQNVTQGSAVTFASVDTGQGANELYDMDQNVTQSSNVTFGTLNCTDLTVGGTTTTINTATLTVDDKNLELGSVATPTDVTANAGGITLKGATDKTIQWLSAGDRWNFNKGLDVTGSSVFSSTITWSGGGSANANTAYTYSQVGHLPLAGGTLTGGLTGTTGTFSSHVDLAYGSHIKFEGSGGNTSIGMQTNSPDTLEFNMDGTAGLYLTATTAQFAGDVTLTGTLNGTTGTFSDNVTIDKADGTFYLANGSGTNRAYLQYQESPNDLVIASLESGSDIKFQPAGNNALILNDDLSTEFIGTSHKFGLLASGSIGDVFDSTIGTRLCIQSVGGSDPVMSLGYYSSGYGLDIWLNNTNPLWDAYYDNRSDARSHIFRNNTGNSGNETVLATIGDNSSFTGTVSWSGGGSANANTAYTYSQVGHLPLAGGTMTGHITLSAGPSNALHPATKAYVDALTGGSTGQWQRASSTLTTINANDKVQVDNNLKALTYTVASTAALGIAGSFPDANDSELGPGYIVLMRDDTANAQQIQFWKNGSKHSYLETKGTGLSIGGADVTVSTGDLVVAAGSVTSLESYIEGTSGAFYQTRANGANNNAPDVYWRKARGSVASPQAVVANDNFAWLNFQGYDGSGYQTAVRINASVDGTPGSNDMGGRLIIETRPDGAGEVVTEALRVNSDQSVTFAGGITMNPNGHFIGDNSHTGDLMIESGGDDIDIVGSWIRMRTTASGSVNAGWHTNGKLTLGADAQNTYMLKVASGNSYFAGDVTVDGNTSIDSNKAIYFGDTGEYIYGSGTHMYIASSGQIYLGAEGFNYTHSVGANAFSITKSGTGNAINVTHTGSHSVFYIDNNSASANAGIHVENTGANGYAILCQSANGSGQSDPLVELNSSNAGFDRPTLKVSQSGTVEALEVVGSATFTGNITGDGAFYLKERASADSDIAAYGQLWIKNATPNEIWFTDDAGTDVQLGVGGGGGGGNLTTKGDLEVYTSSQTRLAVGTDGHVLTADSSEASGLKWAAGGGGGGNLGAVAQNILPDNDNTRDLGSATYRWANAYVADHHLNNTGTKGNDVDFSCGSWTIQEGVDDLFILNRLNGKKYKFSLEEIM